MKTRNLLCLLLTIAMLCSLAVPAYAVTNDAAIIEDLLDAYTLSERIEDAKEGYVDACVSQEILDSITVGMRDTSAYSTRNSNVDSEPVTYAVKSLGQVSKGEVYAVTAAQKTENDSSTLYGVEAWLTVVWIDHFGTQNELVSVSGGWDPGDVELSNRTVEYRIIDGIEYLGAYCEPTTNTFSYPGFDDWFGLTITAESCAVFRHDGTTARIYVDISPTIFD